MIVRLLKGLDRVEFAINSVDHRKQVGPCEASCFRYWLVPLDASRSIATLPLMGGCWKSIALTLLLAVLTGCTTVPHMNQSEDAAAKTFRTKPDVANLYIFRERSIVGAAVGWEIALDGRTLGVLTSGTFVFREIPPGRHVLSRMSDIGEFHFEAGQNYFIHFAPTISWTGTKFQQISEEAGRAAIRNLSRVISAY
ncbi:MAG TPA: DUF2846 domain-containing protein [Verrucomicrobiae bacterium]|nr:DUF2846 domain-containing protein [Verrucomicrobiae bacterium]